MTKIMVKLLLKKYMMAAGQTETPLKGSGSQVYLSDDQYVSYKG